MFRRPPTIFSNSPFYTNKVNVSKVNFPKCSFYTNEVSAPLGSYLLLVPFSMTVSRYRRVVPFTFLKISWKGASSNNVLQLRALWISMFSHRGSLGKPLGGPFPSNVLHYRPLGPLGCCIRFYRRNSSPRLNLHTVLASTHIFWGLGGHMFALFQGC